MEDRSKDRQVLFKARAIASNAECFNVELGESNNPSYIIAARGWTEIDNESDSDYCWVDFENHTVNTVPVPPATSVKLKSFSPTSVLLFRHVIGHFRYWPRTRVEQMIPFLIRRNAILIDKRGELKKSKRKFINIDRIDRSPSRPLNRSLQHPSDCYETLWLSNGFRSFNLLESPVVSTR